MLGLVATMYDGRTRHAREILEDLESRYQLPVRLHPVPKSVRFARRRPVGARSILEHAPIRPSPGAEAYRAIALVRFTETA